ncbi:hypothetical protein KC973_00100 [Candidatus Saccharibacteria bacterium]|nr:hypothetical protein [Candidatus Saccharibacteria bacterium]
MTERNISGPDEHNDASVPEVIDTSRSLLIAELLFELSNPTMDYRDRQSLMDTVQRLNGGVYPDARQQAMLLTMYRAARHEEEHHDAGPDIPG